MPKTKGLGWLEPESAANADRQPKFPYNKITQSESGHSLEMDDTPSRERVKLMHRTGTFIEMHPNGDEVHKIFGDGYEITVRDKDVLVKGDCRITVEGNASLYVMGNKTERINGNYSLVVNGDYNVQVKGGAEIAAQKVLGLTSNPIFGGSLELNTGSLHVNADLTVEGTLRAGDIFSETRVDAFLGMSAGIYGFVSVLGGLSIGIPVALPGNISCIGLVNAAVVNAVVGNFILSDAILMTDLVNTTLYSCHFHITKVGFTTPPIPKMI